MRTLEQYIKESETTQIDEGFLKNLFKAFGKAVKQNVHDAYTKKYPNFVKAFDELQESDAEDKDLIQQFNKLYDAVDKMDLNDDEKVYQKLNLAMGESSRFKDDVQGEGIRKLDANKHKGYLADLQKKLNDIKKNHEEIYDKYQEAAKKNNGVVKKEDVIGGGDNNSEGTQDPQVVDDVTKKSEGIAKATDGNHEAVVAAVKKFLGVSESLNEGKNSEEYKVMFSKENDPKGEKLLALTILLDAWKGLAKQLDRNDKPEQLLPFIQALFANTEFTTEFKK